MKYLLILTILIYCQAAHAAIYSKQLFAMHYAGHNIVIKPKCISCIIYGTNTLTIYCMQEDWFNQLIVDNAPVKPYSMILITQTGNISCSLFSLETLLHNLPDVLQLDDKQLSKLCKAAAMQHGSAAPHVASPNHNATVRPY